MHDRCDCQWNNCPCYANHETQYSYTVKFGVKGNLETKIVFSTLSILRRRKADFFRSKIMEGIDVNILVFEYDLAAVEIWK